MSNVVRNDGTEGDYTPQHIANYFLERGEAEERDITPLKLLKLVYIAYGWYLATTRRRLFSEPIQAWQHGPVIPSIYHEFKHYGKNPIRERSANFDLETFENLEPKVPRSDRNAQLVLDKVWEAYKRFSGWTLRNKTHERDTPWTETYDGEMDRVIPDDLIRRHFEHKIGNYLREAQS